MREINKYSSPLQPDPIHNASPWQLLIDRLPEVGSLTPGQVSRKAQSRPE